MLNAKFNFQSEFRKLSRAIDKKRSRVLMQTGAYGRKVMRNQLSRRSTAKKKNTVSTVSVDGVQCLVRQGLVVDANTSRPVRRETAHQARIMIAQQRRAEGEGQPPKSKSGTLKKNIIFIVDRDGVVIGARPFAKQPRMMGAVSVPQLLEEGGRELVPNFMGGRVFAKYGKRPFVRPSFDPTLKKFRELIESEPLR